LTATAAAAAVAVRPLPKKLRRLLFMWLSFRNEMTAPGRGPEL
jgi:hypothetical protein